MQIETKVGLFTFLGLLLMGLSIYMLGNFTVSKGYDLNVYFKDVSGLPTKSAVRLNGVEVGRVKALALDGDKVMSVLHINQGVIIYRDSRFTIAATSLIGTNYMQIQQGNSQSGVLVDGDKVQGFSLPSMTDMITETMATVQDFTKNINGDGQLARDLNSTLQNLRQLSGNLNELVISMRPYISASARDISEFTQASKNLINKVDDSNGLLNALMQDQQMKDDVQVTLANIKQVSEDAKKFIGQMAKFRMFWEYDIRYQPDDSIFESDLGIKLMPANGFSYYRIGVSNLGNSDNSPKSGKDYRGEPNQIDARLGLYNDWIDVSAGLIRGSGGGVIAFTPLFKATSDIIKSFSVYGEFYDFERNRIINNRLFDSPIISVGARINPTRNIGIGVKYADILESKSVQLTGSISFEDKELAALLGLATLAN